MNDTLEDTRIQVTDNGDHDRFAHYFAKEHIEQALFEGKPCQALCGKWDVPTRDFTKYPVCPECKEAFEALP